MAPKHETAAAPLGLDSDPLSFLVDDAATFLQRQWERKPAVIRASAARKAFFNGLFSWGELQRLAAICDEEGEPLEFGVDVNAARYVGGRRETPNGEVADAQTLKELYSKEGCTMQVHQPQRFSDELWRLLAALEGQLGCLVGCNAYLTPAGTQGLAPHWDDVEIFVVQTQGCKRWRLYAPPAPSAGAAAADAGAARARLLASSHLANQVSGDLLESEIGEPTMEFTLEVGDVLYMPRGCIHQAAAQEGDSAHLTISTYQRWSFADLLQHAVSVALANPALQPLMPQPLKAGLPLGWLSAAGMGPADAAQLAAASGGFGEALPAVLAQAGGSAAAGESKAGLARQLAGACRAMADWLEDEELGPRIVEAAADAVMAEDFMRSRLPPHPVQLPPRGPAPTLKDAVQCVGAGLFRLVPLSGSGSGHDHGGCGSDCEEDHEHGHGHAHHDHAEGEACGAGCAQDEHDHGSGGAGAPPAWVRLVSCLHNDRGSHMLSGGGDDECCEDEEDDSSSDDEEEGDSGSEGEELEAGAEEAASEQASSDSDDDGGGEDGDMQAQLQRLAAAAGAKRKELEATGAASSDEEEEEEEEGSDGEEEEGGSSDDEEEEDEPEDLVFPAEFAPALVQLLGSAPGAAGGASGGRPVPVSQIALPDPELQLQVAAALWDAGVLCTVKAPTKPQKQKQGSAAKQQKKQKRASGKDCAAAPAPAGGNTKQAAGPKPKKQRKA